MDTNLRSDKKIDFELNWDLEELNALGHYSSAEVFWGLEDNILVRVWNLANWLVNLAERIDGMQHLEYKAKRLALTDEEAKFSFFCPET